MAKIAFKFIKSALRLVETDIEEYVEEIKDAEFEITKLKALQSAANKVFGPYLAEGYKVYEGGYSVSYPPDLQIRKRLKSSEAPREQARVAKLLGVSRKDRQSITERRGLSVMSRKFKFASGGTGYVEIADQFSIKGASYITLTFVRFSLKPTKVKKKGKKIIRRRG